jgi:hypothetical protein
LWAGETHGRPVVTVFSFIGGNREGWYGLELLTKKTGPLWTLGISLEKKIPSNVHLFSKLMSQ